MVKCIDCGLLCYRDNRNNELKEFILAGRRSGTSNDVVCFGLVNDLEAEYQAEKYRHTQHLDRQLEILRSERECAVTNTKYGFTKYLQGFSPKEHIEMMTRERQSKIEQEQRDWIAEQRRLDLEWREKQDREEKTWRAEQEQKTKGQFFWSLVILGIAASLIVSAATIWAAFISRG